MDDGFDACWACGALRDGEIDPEFRHADTIDPLPPAEKKTQLELGGLFRLITAFCFVFAFIGSIIAGRPNIVTAMLGFLGLGYLFLCPAVWLLSRLARLCQEKMRSGGNGSANR